MKTSGNRQMNEFGRQILQQLEFQIIYQSQMYESLTARDKLENAIREFCFKPLSFKVCGYTTINKYYIFPGGTLKYTLSVPTKPMVSVGNSKLLLLTFTSIA